MFNLINWDTLGDLLSDIIVIGLLCVFLFIWASRLRAKEERARQAAEHADPEPPPSPGNGSPP